MPIVKKIIEEHGGSLMLEDAPIFEGQNHFGAMAVIKLPLSEPEAGEEPSHISTQTLKLQAQDE